MNCLRIHVENKNNNVDDILVTSRCVKTQKPKENRTRPLIHAKRLEYLLFDIKKPPKIKYNNIIIPNFMEKVNKNERKYYEN